MSDCLGAEKRGHSESKSRLLKVLMMNLAQSWKIFITTYSSNISRMNQAIEVARKYNRKICFMGRSFLKAQDIGRKLKYMDLPVKMEIRPQIKRFPPSNVLILVAGSQAQIESGLVRISRGSR